MTQTNLADDLFQYLIFTSYIYRSKDNPNSYIAILDGEVLFEIGFNRNMNAYYLYPSDILKQQIKMYNIPKESIPKISVIWGWADFQHYIDEMIINREKNTDTIYKTMLYHSTITHKIHRGLDTYTINGNGQPHFRIEYNPKTKQYGFYGYDKLISLHETLGISTTQKPDYRSLYKQAKDVYLAQELMESFNHYC